MDFKFFRGYSNSMIVESIEVEGNGVRIWGTWSPEMTQNLSVYGIDFEEHITSILSEELRREIDREGLTLLFDKL